MKKTIKTAYIREPHNYWITRRVWVDETGKEYVKINYSFTEIEWLLMRGWEVNLSYQWMELDNSNSERRNNMETLKKIYELINNTNHEIYDLYEKYPTAVELQNSEEYKIICAKVEAYQKVFNIVRVDLRELRSMVGEMADL